MSTYLSHSQQTWAEGNDRKKIKNKKPYRFQIVANGPNQQWRIGNEWESSRIGDGSWLIGNGSSATVQSIAGENKAKCCHRFGDAEWAYRWWWMATLQRFIGNGEWRCFNGFVATVNGDASMGSWRRWMAMLRRRRFNGEWVSFFLFGFLSFFVWVSMLQWVSGWMFFFLAEWVNIFCFLFGSIYSGI